MYSHRPVLLFAVLLLLFGTGTLAAQSGSISGTVFDTDGSTTLPGASIYLQDNSSIGTASDFDGTFVLGNVPAGEQAIQVSYTGYGTQTLTVAVVPGEVTELDIVLEAMAISGETVLVTAQALGQAKAINQQLNSDAIANFVSADKIKELPDVNAAEAISRLPGVAINRSGGEGSKVVVRGLDPKFTAISINGVRLPSTSGVDRSVDLSLISPELLSGIELFKSPTPDMDGDALGGSINLNIIRAPKEPKASVKLLGGYNAITDTYRDYKATASYSRRLFKDKLGITATGNVERFNRSGERISQGWQDNDAIILDTLNNILAQEGNNLRFEEQMEIRKRQNGSLGLDFELGQQTDVTILGIFSRTSRDRFDYTESYDVNNNRLDFNGNIVESAISLYSASISTRHQLGSKLGIEWGAALSRVEGETPYNLQLDFRNQNTPFEQEVQKTRTRPAGFYDFLSPRENAFYLQRHSFGNSGNSEEIKSGFVNLELPVQVAENVRATLKVGGKVINNQKDRTFEEFFRPNLYLIRNNILSGGDEEAVGATGVDPSGAFYYSMDNFSGNETLRFQREGGQEVDLLRSLDPDRLRAFNDRIGNSLLRPNRYQQANNYDLEENVYAGFVMLKVKIGEALTVIPGFRYEYSDNSYNGLYAELAGDFGESGGIRPDSAAVTYGIPLPHLHVKYKPLEWLDFRASYSTTLARPDYNYIVPATNINTSQDVVIDEGNPDLNASVSTNYDFFVTAYSGKWGLLSGGVFYKDIKDAFYPFIVGLNTDSLSTVYGFGDRDFTGARLTTYANSPESVVRGFEIELQSNLNFLPGLLRGLVANVNYTRLSSETTINSFRTESQYIGVFPFGRTEILTFPTNREVALVGQASDIFNASLGYDYKQSFSMRFSASYQGDKIAGYSSRAAKDQYNRGFWRFDAALKKKFDSGLNLFLNVNNISNQRDINYFTNFGKEFVTSVTRYGLTATVGAEYKFYQ